LLATGWHPENVSDDLDKVTIVRSRYGGTYEPGVWIAFPCWPSEVGSDWNADDVSCAGFFAERADEIGGGDTPQDAYDDLRRRLEARRSRLRPN